MNNQKNNMATASMIMGIFALVFLCCYGGLLFGGLGILFALLSRTEEYFTGQARAGLIMSVIALALSVFLYGAFVFAALQFGSISYGPIQNLPVHPELPELTMPDNVLWNVSVWTGGVVI